MELSWGRARVSRGGGPASCCTLADTAHARSRRTCVYLSMNMSALGTLWSPRCTTEDPTHEPMRAWTLRKVRRKG